MTINLIHYLYFTCCLFLIGSFGIFLNRKNIILLLMAIELLLLAVNMNFIIFSYYLNDITGYVVALFILTVAAAESAIGLALLVVYYRLRNNIYIEYINTLKG